MGVRPHPPDPHRAPTGPRPPPWRALDQQTPSSLTLTEHQFPNSTHQPGTGWSCKSRIRQAPYAEGWLGSGRPTHRRGVGPPALAGQMAISHALRPAARTDTTGNPGIWLIIGWPSIHNQSASPLAIQIPAVIQRRTRRIAWCSACGTRWRPAPRPARLHRVLPLAQVDPPARWRDTCSGPVSDGAGCTSTCHLDALHPGAAHRRRRSPQPGPLEAASQDGQASQAYHPPCTSEVGELHSPGCRDDPTSHSVPFNRNPQ